MTVPGTATASNPVVVPVDSGATITVSGLAGQVCLAPPAACVGPTTGMTATTCNNLTGDECVCAPACPSALFGVLLRDNCVAVNNGSFTASSSSLKLYVNDDCEPTNNSGSYTLSLEW